MCNVDKKIKSQPGKLYGIGIGPGDPELITLKATRILAQCKHIFVPKARDAEKSIALAIAKTYINPEAEVYEIVFPMSRNKAKLQQYWNKSAQQVVAVLKKGKNACFLTLGDSLLYSTYIYLIRALRRWMPRVEIITIPGITAFSAAAALTNFPLGEAKKPVIIIPASDNLKNIRKALATKSTVILMKIGKCLNNILDILEETDIIDQGVFVSHAGMDNQRVETNLQRLREAGEEIGYLSTILVHTKKDNKG